MYNFKNVRISYTHIFKINLCTVDKAGFETSGRKSFQSKKIYHFQQIMNVENGRSMKEKRKLVEQTEANGKKL